MDASTVPRSTPLAGRRPAALLRLAGDERLVSEVRAGSETAFEAVYDRHHRGILGFCRHMLGSPEEAEDATQHTFMAAYRSLQGSDNPIQLKAWLYTIARNRCVSMLRTRREQPSDDVEGASFDGLAAEVERRQDLRDLVRDVSALPDDQRAALVLAELGDVSHAEIAAVLEVPPPKVKALVFQARTSLMASRDARDTPCEEVQEQLANLRGGSLRRTTLRRHLRECAGCREFRAKLTAQRAGLAVALPVVPALGFKETVLAAVFGGGGGAGGAAVLAGGSGLGAVAAKGLIAALAVGGGVAGVAAVTPNAGSSSAVPPAQEQRQAQPGQDGGSSPGPGSAAGTTAGEQGADDPGGAARTAEERREDERRGRGGDDDGDGRSSTRGEARDGSASAGSRSSRDRGRTRDDRRGGSGGGSDGGSGGGSDSGSGGGSGGSGDRGSRGGSRSGSSGGSTPSRDRPQPSTPKKPKPAKPKPAKPKPKPAKPPKPKPAKPKPAPPPPAPAPTAAPPAGGNAKGHDKGKANGEAKGHDDDRDGGDDGDG